MQVFALPGRISIYGVSFDGPNGRPLMGRQDPREWQAIDSVLAHASDLSAGMTGQARPAFEDVSVRRPGLYDSIDDVSVLGGMTMRYATGRPLSLMFTSVPPKDTVRQRPTDLYVMKVPSDGAWSVQREFVMDREEESLIADLVPVLCDPLYPLDRAQGLAGVCHAHNIVPDSMVAIPAGDERALRRLASDRVGGYNLVPMSQLVPGDEPAQEDDEWADDERERRPFDPYADPYADDEDDDGDYVTWNGDPYADPFAGDDDDDDDGDYVVWSGDPYADPYARGDGREGRDGGTSPSREAAASGGQSRGGGRARKAGHGGGGEPQGIPWWAYLIGIIVLLVAVIFVGRLIVPS